MHIVGLCGSLRKGSLNAKVLRAAQSLLPAGVELTIESFADFPFYNEDVRTEGEPNPVIRLKRTIADADAVLIVSPEYNYSVPGVLKNALDWMSRGPDLPFDGKPVAVMGASIGLLGTARGQYHLRQVLQFMNTFTLNKPEVFIGHADKKFDADGRLVDDMAIFLMTQQLVALQKLVQRLNPVAVHTS